MADSLYKDFITVMTLSGILTYFPLCSLNDLFVL